MERKGRQKEQRRDRVGKGREGIKVEIGREGKGKGL